MTKNAYIHIPFCKSKCNYCSFISTPELELKEDYLNALKKEIQSRYGGEIIDTLYIGGGTPSLLETDEINNLVALFNTDKSTEITVEMNPDSFKYCNANRVSLGVQTFDNNILKLIGRRHNVEDVKKIINHTGFDNISIDLIYGLPTQTLKGFENDLKQALELNIRHISLYGLKIEKGCYFYKNQPNNLPDNDLQADMYLKAIEILTQNGFEHYEISNFSKQKPSRHNLNYWDNNSYYGFGAAAHGYENGIRYANSSDIKKYITDPLTNENKSPLSEQEKLEEEIFLGFRKTAGINITAINEKYGIDFDSKYAKIIEKYPQILKTESGYRLSTEGILLSNEILSEFLQ